MPEAAYRAVAQQLTPLCHLHAYLYTLPTMFRNYLITALRTFYRKKAYTLINIVGLATGLASSFLIFLWVQDEYRVDRFHEYDARLYQVLKNDRFSDGQISTSRSVPTPLAQALEDNFPEIQQAEPDRWGVQLLVANGEDRYREQGNYVGQDFFEIFSYPFVQGNPKTALQDINAVVISETLARKYFGAQPAVGKTLRLDDQKEVQVTGVFQDIPSYSSNRFSFAMPIEKFNRDNEWTQEWGNSGMRMFVLLAPQTDVDQLNAKVKHLVKEHVPDEDTEVFLRPYADDYLYSYSNFEDGQRAGGRITYVRMFSLIALFILIIACINFMNLTTARSAQRAKEVGIRKAIGARKGSLVWQFMAESTLIVLFALGLSLLLTQGILPFFNQLTGKSMSVDYRSPTTLGIIAGVGVFTGLLAGSYPAFFLSSFQPVKVLKGTVGNHRGAALFRKSLVVFQFAVSILLIVGTFVVYQQIDYIQHKNLGLDKDNVAYVYKEGALGDQYESFKQELLQQPGVASVTASSSSPLDVGHSTESPEWEGKNPDDYISFLVMNTDYDFIETMGMHLRAGRDFSRLITTDTANYLINETAARVMGMDDPVGQPLTMWGQAGTIVGMIADFHAQSLYEDISPLILRLAPQDTDHIFIKTEAGQTSQALESIEKVGQAVNPAFPFEYQFLDQDFQRLYERETVISQLANIFTLMAMVISCLGLLGLASFTAEQRTKEIGVRKVLGASVSHLVMLLSGEFTKLVIIGFVLACPLAYYLMDRWLQSFAYRTQLSVSLFVLAGATALVIAWLTVGYQSVRAARSNPVSALRSE